MLVCNRMLTALALHLGGFFFGVWLAGAFPGCEAIKVAGLDCGYFFAFFFFAARHA